MLFRSTGLPGAGEVKLSQTVDPGEVLSDVAADLVADIAALTGDQGELLGLTAEVLPSADPTQNEHSATITIPSDVGNLSEPTQLNVSAAGTFAPGGGGSVTINPGDTAQQVAELLGAQLQISAPHH